MPNFEKFIESPYTALSVAIVLGALALSGKFNVTATQFLLFGAWAVATLGLRTQPLPVWIGASAIIGGGLLLLGYWFHPEIIPGYAGTLKPPRQTLFSTKNAAALPSMEIGDSGAIFTYDGPPGSSMFLIGESNLTVEREGNQVKVSTQIRDENGMLVAEIISNEWKVAPPPGTFDRNYTSDALEVRNAKGHVVLQVKALHDRIRIQGEWWGSDGYGVKFVKSPDPSQPGALIIQYPLKDPRGDVQIQPMFEYPSETHFGELRRQK